MPTKEEPATAKEKGRQEPRGQFGLGAEDHEGTDNSWILYPHKGNKPGTNNKFNNKLPVEDNIRNLSKGFSELNNKGCRYNHGTKTTK